MPWAGFPVIGVPNVGPQEGAVRRRSDGVFGLEGRG